MSLFELELEIFQPVEVKTMKDYEKIKDKIPHWITYEYIQNNGNIFGKNPGRYEQVRIQRPEKRENP